MSSDGDWQDVGPVEEIPEGGYGVLETDQAVIAVFRVDGKFFAIEDVCTHDGEELTGIRTGKALTPPAYEDLPTYPVRVLNGRVQVQED